jgi:hypothetical protein
VKWRINKFTSLLVFGAVMVLLFVNWLLLRLWDNSELRGWAKNVKRH